MPRILPAFAFLFIAFPGALIWLTGASLAVGSIAALIRGTIRDPSLTPVLVVAAAAAAGCMLAGYLMVIFTRILCGDPREKFAAHHQPQRVAWELGIQATGVFLVAGGIASVHNILIRNWGLLLPSIALFVSSIVFYFLISGRWHKRRQLWLKELEDLQPSHGSPPVGE